MTDRGLEAEVDAATLRRAVELVRFVRNPVFTGMVVAVVLVLAGAATIIASGLGAGDETYVALQLPYLVSGGFGGVALVVVGCLVASILGNRRDDAAADAELAAVSADIADLSRSVLRRRNAS